MIKKTAKNTNAKMKAGNAQKRYLPFLPFPQFLLFLHLVVVPVDLAPVVALMRGLGK